MARDVGSLLELAGIAGEAQSDHNTVPADWLTVLVPRFLRSSDGILAHCLSHATAPGGSAASARSVNTACETQVRKATEVVNGRGT